MITGLILFALTIAFGIWVVLEATNIVPLGLLLICYGLFVAHIAPFGSSKPSTPKTEPAPITVVHEPEDNIPVVDKSVLLARPHDVNVVIGYAQTWPELAPLVDAALADDKMTKDECDFIQKETHKFVLAKDARDVSDNIKKFKASRPRVILEESNDPAECK